jgi:hypothetical protein
MNGTRQRDWSVFPVWITDAPTMEYAKVGARWCARHRQAVRFNEVNVSGYLGVWSNIRRV